MFKNWCISASPFSWFLVILGSPWGYLLGAWGALWVPLGLFFDHFYVKLCFLGAEWAPRPSQRCFFIIFWLFLGESGEDLGWISNRFLNSSLWFFLCYLMVLYCASRFLLSRLKWSQNWLKNGIVREFQWKRWFSQNHGFTKIKLRILEMWRRQKVPIIMTICVFHRRIR